MGGPTNLQQTSALFDTQLLLAVPLRATWTAATLARLRPPRLAVWCRALSRQDAIKYPNKMEGVVEKNWKNINISMVEFPASHEG